ncbi:hypothetical protein EC9_16380 [Rosistilla ulvae]|uniref:DUF547 domain-containing protein n=1 Tax=Rosistilla ulvae TaxID=1930277 RepID=A0A517LXW8_9BACT|nr:DUF547 domain-containing protein [Rosistilla ulvae]QDS87460.1 hypothetical protein EC9_16380 [Rosistilla ulvae]
MLNKYAKSAVVAFLFIVASDPVASAGSPVYVGTRVAANQQVSIDQIDHSTWDTILRKYVDANGMVNYQGLKASAADRQALSRYLNRLSSANPNAPATPGSTLAFWINAYNAVTVQGILREYPTSSIRNHTAKLWGYNIWKDLQLYVGGKPYSLDQMEHEVLRKKGEPRIHFAIVCASIGCPRLLNEAYVAERIQDQLDANAKDFFSRSQNFRYDAPARKFQLSSILDWFGEDFGGDQATQLKKIAPWLPSPAAQQAARQNAVRVSYLDYNWNLNAQSAGR